MAITLRVTGNGHFSGSQTALFDYSVTEDSTPIDASDSSGGVGVVTFSVIEDAGSEGTILLLNDTVELEDASNGRTQGTVSSVSVDNGAASISADSRLGLLMATKTAQPYVGTLGGAFTYYLGLCGITTGLVIDSTIASRSVVFPGWNGVVWEYMKRMCTAQGVEISLVSSNVVLRPLRGRIAEINKDSSRSWSVQNSSLAQSIEIYYYNNQSITNGMVYPSHGWNEDLSIYQVDAGQTLEVDIPVDVSVSSVNQPTCVSFVDRDYSGSTSVYAVVGNDGLPITPAQWNAQGGSISVAIGDDTNTLKVTIVGASETQYAPYRIAVASGASDYYSSLRITGSGVAFDKQLLTILTGASAAKTAQVVGATIDNPFISTLTDAYSAGMLAAGKWASPAQTIRISSIAINRKGEPGNVNYPTFTNFNTQYAGKTFAQFDTLNTGLTFAAFDAAQLALVQDNFENQAFGNVSGARVLFRDSWYRVRNATITPAAITYTAERDTLFSDFNLVNAAKTFGQFDTKWAGKAFEDFGVISLWQ